MNLVQNYNIGRGIYRKGRPNSDCLKRCEKGYDHQRDNDKPLSPLEVKTVRRREGGIREVVAIDDRLDASSRFDGRCRLVMTRDIVHR